LGTYEIVGRLGEGGMGSVFLANSATGQPVALKVIRTELADNAEFRRRFRSEVARAREVPPFCTAEVLDADTEHDPPYLVVEYVDGPSLSDVVGERGPLTPANQHGIAVGVAVALTAIHGAGVIHRDLKPSNVLLAPGSPKVIDFGIARAATGSDSETKTDQVVGTVAYMAPERFGPNASQAITPAADVFAWGAIVAYAATGRTPFGAEIPAAMAVRIMTQPPDLDGLTGPLRELVERALAKDPADRPTARELVDHLLTGGAPLATRPAAFAEQPEILAAAGISPTNVAPPAFVAPGPALVAPAPTMVTPQPVPVNYGPPPGFSGRPGVAAVPPPRAPASPGAVYATGSRRRGRGRWLASLGLALVLAAGAGTAYAFGYLPIPGKAEPEASNSTDPGPGVAEPSVVPGATLFNHGLAEWQSRPDATYGANCEVKPEKLTVTLNSTLTATYRCPGPTANFTDFSLAADVFVADANSCAGIWFRFTGSSDTRGYALRVCHDRFELVRHVGTTVSAPAVLFANSESSAGETVRVAMKVTGNTFVFFRDGQVSQPVQGDGTYPVGRVVLGVFAATAGQPGPFTVAFSNVAIWGTPIATPTLS
jgi:hypothetical protein